MLIFDRSGIFCFRATDNTPDIKILDRHILLSLHSRHCEPMCETAAGKKKPHDTKDKKDQTQHNRSDEIVHQCDHTVSGITAESSAKEGIRSELHRYECKDERSEKCAADSDECHPQKADAPVPEKESESRYSQEEDKCEASQSEETADKKMSPTIAYLSGSISHLHFLVKHIRGRHQTLILLPGHQIRH